MKTVLKVIGTTIGAVFIAVTAIVATIPLWFPVDKVKGAIIEQLEEKTGRNVEIKDLQFNIFKGFELKGFTIKESARYGTKRDFIKDDRIVLKYNLFALFARELVVEKFELVSPYIEIVKEENGNYNFTDIVNKLAQDKEKAAEDKTKTRLKAEKKTAPARIKKASPIKNIIITSVGVSNGNFVYADYSKPKRMSLKVQNFNFDMENMILAAVKPIGINMNCTVIFNEYKIPASLKSTAKVDIQKKSAVLDIVSLIIGGIDTSGKVSIVDFKDAKGSLVSVSNVKKMLEVLPPDLSAKLKDVNASIDITNSVNFTYTDRKFAFNDVLKMDNGEFIYKNSKFVEKFSGEMNISSKYEMTGSVNFLLAGNEVKIKAEASDIDSPADSVYRVDIYSPKFAAEYLLAMFPKKEQKKIAKAAAAKKTKVKKKKLSGTPGVYLNLKADAILYKDVTIGKTIANIRFVNAKLYSDISMMCYEGSMSSNVVMDINEESYTLTADIKAVKVNKLIDDAVSVIPKKDPKKKNVLDDIKDKVYGSIDMKSSFRGSTFSEPALTISGEGSFNVKNGKIAATDTGRDLASKVGVTFLSNEIPFDTMSADFNMAKGRINIKDFKVLNGPNGENGAIKIRANGYTTVDRALDFKVETDINPKEAKQVEEYFARNLNIRDVSFAYDKSGWLPFDVSIYGTMTEKKYDYSQKRMMDNISRNLTKKAEETGKKFIEDKGKELIKNLFGK
jgi:uncharacterized protein involved in outer membrane biogenesis